MMISLDPSFRIAREVPDVSPDRLIELLRTVRHLCKLSDIYIKDGETWLKLL